MKKVSGLEGIVELSYNYSISMAVEKLSPKVKDTESFDGFVV